MVRPELSASARTEYEKGCQVVPGVRSHVQRGWEAARQGADEEGRGGACRATNMTEGGPGGEVGGRKRWRRLASSGAGAGHSKEAVEAQRGCRPGQGTRSRKVLTDVLWGRLVATHKFKPERDRGADLRPATPGRSSRPRSQEQVMAKSWEMCADERQEAARNFLNFPGAQGRGPRGAFGAQRWGSTGLVGGHVDEAQ